MKLFVPIVSIGVYDTEKAQLVHSVTISDDIDNGRKEETLYRTTNGSYFLHKKQVEYYFVDDTYEDVDPQELIEPLSLEGAMSWLTKCPIFPELPNKNLLNEIKEI